MHNRELPWWTGYAVTLAAELALTAVLGLLAPVFPIADFPIPYVLLTMVAAYVFGTGPAIAAFFMGLACFVYAFPPYHGIWPLAVRARDWAGIVALLLGSAIVGFATGCMRRSRNRAEALAEELQRSGMRTTETLESIAECFFALDSELRFLDINRVAEQTVFLRSIDGLLGKSLIEQYPELAGSEFEEQCRVVLSSQHEAHFEHGLWLEGRWFECHVFAYGACLEVYMREVTDRRRAEEALRNSEGQYRSLIETMNEGFCVTDADYVLTYVNLRFAEMIGYPQSEIVGHRVPEFLDESSRKILETQIPERRMGRYLQYELTWAAKDGGHVHALISPRPVFDSDGQFVGSFAAVTDITDLKHSEEALRESEHRYRELFQNANDGIFLLELSDSNPPGRFIDVNNVACQRLGYTREELLTMGPAEVDSPETAKEVPGIMKAIQEKGHGTFEAVQMTKDGRRIPSEISAHLFWLGDREVVLAIARDITERKLAEDTLRRSEERFRDLFNRAADCLFLHDLEGRFVEVNREACETLGYSREELLGLTVGDIVVDYDRATLEALWSELMTSPRTVEVTHRRKDGSTLLVEGRLSTLEYRGQLLILAVVRDITERKRAEDERRALEQHMEDQKRLFYRETILSVTDGKLDICDERDIAPYVSSAEIEIGVSGAKEVSVARRGVEGFLGGHGLSGDRLNAFMIGVGEAITNAVKHGTEGTVYASASDGTVWVGIADNGPGIESLILPRAVLLRGFSTKPSLGLGYCVMLDVADRIHLKTDEKGTVVILEKGIEEPSSQPDLRDLPDTWGQVGVEELI